MSQPSEMAPRLPLGTSSIFSGLSENLSFHASPESFIVERILQYHRQNPTQVDQRTCLRAKILNRNVAIVSSYRQVSAILEATGQESGSSEDALPQYVAAAPYSRLMEPFFPPRNLLLEDGCPHAEMKSPWKTAVIPLSSPDVQNKLATMTADFLHRSMSSAETTIDLYSMLKDLAWELFLDTFLDLQPSDPGYSEFERLQEDLLRGQFSLLPVSINTGFWHSPRKIGIDSRKKLQTIISKRLEHARPMWLAEEMLQNRREETVNHLLMSTSSLAVKGFASLMLALLLNVHLYRRPGAGANGDESLLGWIQNSSPGSEQHHRGDAVLQETLRLSAPIVGVMRRSTVECTLPGNGEEPDVLIPAGWDAWTYFPGANRDSTAFQDPDIFRPERYLARTADAERADDTVPPPIAFGAGSKQCLGIQFIRCAALSVVEGFQRAGIRIQGEVEALGVRGWLGWEVAAPEDWARDMKQLPTQRPARPVTVTLMSSAT